MTSYKNYVSHACIDDDYDDDVLLYHISCIRPSNKRSRTTYLQEAATEAQSILNTGVKHHSILRRRFSVRRSEFTLVNPYTNSVFALLRSLLQQSLQEAGRSDHSFNMSVAIWGCFVRALQRRTAFQALQRRC